MLDNIEDELDWFGHLVRMSDEKQSNSQKNIGKKQKRRLLQNKEGERLENYNSKNHERQIQYRNNVTGTNQAKTPLRHRR